MKGRHPSRSTGDFEAHGAMLDRIGAEYVFVRTPSDMPKVVDGRDPARRRKPPRNGNFWLKKAYRQKLLLAHANPAGGRKSLARALAQSCWPAKFAIPHSRRWPSPTSR